ncbi:MAG: hypothetical protein DCE92_02020 [Alphaproteobacteria bacterium]|nr:MAG: hypothetical protein DCE92_02020 [Alphaproteobacteria bacterium]
MNSLRRIDGIAGGRALLIPFIPAKAGTQSFWEGRVWKHCGKAIRVFCVSQTLGPGFRRDERDQ